MDKIAEKVENLVGHHRKLEEDLEELRSEWQVLKWRKTDVNSRIQAEVEVHSDQEVKKEVEGWLEDVQKIEQDIQDVEERVGTVPYYKRASLDKLVREKIELVKRIQGRGIFEGGLGIKRAPACGMVIPTENLEGEISTKDEIWEHLMGNKVGMIGVCGIGGVGKTTIMKHVNNDLLTGSRFQKVIWVTVSYPLNVLELQKKIALAMGRSLPEDKEEIMRAAALMEIMGRNGCKVVITSRSVDVCNSLGCKIVKKQPLSPQESLNLFLDKVGHDVLQVSGLEEILKLIVQECAGLPLAIVVIAGGMRGEYDIIEWRNALNELSQCVKSVKGMEDKIYGRKELIEGWIDGGLIDELGKRQEAYDRGHAFLNRLEKNCLLEKTIGQGGQVFKMHDVVPNESEWVRDLKKVSLMANGISKIPVGLILSNNADLAEIPSSFFEDMVGLKVLDLSGTSIKALPDSISNLVNLSALRLRKCKRLKYFPSLAKLSALKKLDLHKAGIEEVPQGMAMLVSLEYLDLFCPKLKEIPTGILPSLPTLQYLVVYLSSAMTKRINLEEVARLSKLQSLECGIEVIQDFNYLANKSKDFESLMAYGLRLTTGKQDITAHGFSDEYQHKVLILDCEIGEECIALPDQLEGIECMVELDYSSSSLSCPVLDKVEKLYINNSPNLSALVRVEGVATPQPVFSNLKSLLLHTCSGMRTLLPFELLHAFQNLEEIWISFCKQMEEIIASSDSDASSDIFNFPKLRKLRLDYLPQLKSICSGKGVMVCDSIEEITVRHCRKLQRIPLQLLLLDNGQPAPPPHLREINIVERESKEWWESLEWDHPNAQNMLQPFLKLHHMMSKLNMSRGTPITRAKKPLFLRSTTKTMEMCGWEFDIGEANVGEQVF
ncbi:hypothetical protein SLEP1_g4945 [Rubroshorea leprosula]|uniref:Disease resistance protein n=1 Tax=Rubroshorea leprosula TaxID=152421 RepID=A0AAV5I129_9ROSI|nr:hypothetical protein SLEP1_g4945 [Rubroshorea leprosula]